MAEISRTRNLEAFQSKFDRVTDAGHEVEAKLNRRGEAFLVKGRGKSKRSKVWFAIKHPQVAWRDGRTNVKNRNVVLALKTAAKRDLGPNGLKLVDGYLKAVKYDANKGLTKKQADMVVELLKLDPPIVRKDGRFMRDANAYLNSTVGENLLISLTKKEFSPENAFFLIDSKKAMDILNSKNTAPDVKRAAYELIVKRYAHPDGVLTVNLTAGQREALLKLEATKGRFSPDQLTEATKALQDGIDEIVAMLKNDTLMRASLQTRNILENVDLAKMEKPLSTFPYSIGENRHVDEGTVKRLTLDLTEDLAKGNFNVEMPKKKIQNVAPKRVAKKKKIKIAPKKAMKKAQPKQVKKEKPVVKLEADRPAPKLKAEKPVRKAKADKPERVIKRVKVPKKSPALVAQAKVKKFLAKTPSLRGKFNQLNDDDFGKIVNNLKEQGRVFSKDTEYLAISMARKILDDRANNA